MAKEEFKNKEVFPVTGDVRMRITVDFNADEDCKMETHLRNAAAALIRQADVGNMHTWVNKIEVERA